MMGVVCEVKPYQGSFILPLAGRQVRGPPGPPKPCMVPVSGFDPVDQALASTLKYLSITSLPAFS